MKILFPLVILSVLTGPLAAQSEKTVKSNQTPLPTLSSAEHRSNKSWQMTFGPGYLHPFLGARARVSAFLDGNSLVFAELSGGIAGQALAPVVRWASTATEGRKFAAGYKLFLANSFYVEGSGFYRRMNRNEDPYLFSSDAAGVEFMIGNQWQWKRFTLGLDLIGCQVPLTVFREKSVNGDGSENFRRRAQDFEDLGKRVAAIVLGFYIGFTF